VPVAPNAATAVFATPQDQLFRGTRLAPHQKFAAPPHRTTRFSATPQYRNTDTPQHPALRSTRFSAAPQYRHAAGFRFTTKSAESPIPRFTVDSPL